jgi:hypothetical protein
VLQRCARQAALPGTTGSAGQRANAAQIVN